MSHILTCLLQFVLKLSVNQPACLRQAGGKGWNFLSIFRLLGLCFETTFVSRDHLINP